MQGLIETASALAKVFLPMGTVVGVVKFLQYVNEPNKIEVPLYKEIKLLDGTIKKEQYKQVRVRHSDINKTIEEYKDWSYVREDSDNTSMDYVLTFKKLE